MITRGAKAADCMHVCVCVLMGVYVSQFIVYFVIIYDYPFLSLAFAEGLEAPGNFLLAAQFNSVMPICECLVFLRTSDICV